MKKTKIFFIKNRLYDELMNYAIILISYNIEMKITKAMSNLIYTWGLYDQLATYVIFVIGCNI
jgi:hypothetical protein